MNNIIYPCLWFNGQAKEAASFYCTVFNNAHITADTPIVVTFEAAGQKFMCLNGGPQFAFNPSVSFFVQIETAADLEQAWNALSADGKVLMPLDTYPWNEKYGWVQDRFGVNWQLALGKIAAISTTFIPALMFTGEQAGKAANAIDYYTSVFAHSSLISRLDYTEADKEVSGTIKHAQFKLGEQYFIAMDSSFSHGFNFNEAVSFVVDCKTQAEIDHYWNALSKGGSEGNCGWLKDQFGVSWQIVPAVLGELMTNPERSGRVMQAFMKMKKFDIETLLTA